MYFYLWNKWQTLPEKLFLRNFKITAYGLTIQYLYSYDKLIFYYTNPRKHLKVFQNSYINIIFYKKSIINIIYKYKLIHIYVRKFPVFTTTFL